MIKVKLVTVSVVTVLLLYLLFIGSAAAALILGTEAQDSLGILSEQSFDTRTLPAFITEKIRTGDGGGDIYTADFGGSSALFIESSIEGVLYTNIIYAYNGQLLELFCEKDAPFSREDGTQLAPLGTVDFSEPKTGLIYVVVKDLDGETSVLYIFLRSGGEV